MFREVEWANISSYKVNFKFPPIQSSIGLNLKLFIHSPLSFMDPVGRTETKKLFKSALRKL